MLVYQLADLHTFRALIVLPAPSLSVNTGIHANKSLPLTSPEQTPEIEALLLAHTLETEAFRGTPGAYINLNMSNEDFLGRDDDLFVTRHMPHDDVHNLVKYNETPIYDQLKTDSSKAMVSKELFEKAPYDIQIKCLKEEAMVIALNRFLLPESSTDHLSSYRSALICICTRLIGGFFRQFIIDNFPRLKSCDKDLTEIQGTILGSQPPEEKKEEDRTISTSVLKDENFNLTELDIVQQLLLLTKKTTPRSLGQRISHLKKKEPNPPKEESSSTPSKGHRRGGGGNFYGSHNFNHSNESFYTIESCIPNHEPLIIGFTSCYKFQQECLESIYHYNGTVSAFPMDANAGLNKVRKYEPGSSGRYGIFRTFENENFIKIGLESHASYSMDSWGGEDALDYAVVQAHLLKNGVKHLGVHGLAEELLLLYIVALLNPHLKTKGEEPFEAKVDAVKVLGLLPLHPEHHLWFDLWKLQIQKN